MVPITDLILGGIIGILVIILQPSEGTAVLGT
jgi:hypothetical protein